MISTHTGSSSTSQERKVNRTFLLGHIRYKNSWTLADSAIVSCPDPTLSQGKGSGDC